MNNLSIFNMFFIDMREYFENLNIILQSVYPKTFILKCRLNELYKILKRTNETNQYDQSFWNDTRLHFFCSDLGCLRTVFASEHSLNCLYKYFARSFYPCQI